MGYVYILCHEDFLNLYKIGFTNLSVAIRVKQLNSQTGVVGKPFKEVYSLKSENAKLVEKIAHGVLKYRDCLIENEYFEVRITEAKKIIQKSEAYAGEYQNNMNDCIKKISNEIDIENTRFDIDFDNAF